MSYDLGEYWEERANFYSEPMDGWPRCANCGCPAHVGWCETKLPIYRQVSDWKDTCGCTNYESIEASDVIAEENPENV